MAYEFCPVKISRRSSRHGPKGRGGLYLNINRKFIHSACNLVFCQQLWSHGTTALYKSMYYYY